MTAATESGTEGLARRPIVPPRSVKALVVKVLVWAVVVIVLFQIPLISDRPTVQKLTTVICIAIAALGLNLLTGFNGQISVGHGAFMGIGAYTTAILIYEHNVNAWLTIAIGALLAFVVGVIVGLPALRIRGVYLALVTLALAVMFPQIVVKFSDVTGGTQGIDFEPEQEFAAPAWTGLKDNQWRYYVALGFALVLFVLVRNLVKSRSGRGLVAIRDNETSAAVLGVNVGVYKVMAFGLSAMIAGIGGSLLVLNTSHVDSKEFGIDLSIKILVAVVVGGVATYIGPAVGAFFVIYLQDLFPTNFPKQLSPVLFAALLIVLMIVAPGGVVGLAKQAWAALRRRAGSAPPAPTTADPPEAVASG